MDINDVWNKSQAYILSEIKSSIAYNTYIKDAFAISYEGSVFTIAVMLPTRKSIIEIKYRKIIETALSRIIGLPVSLNVIISNGGEAPVITEPVKTEQEVIKTNEEYKTPEINNTPIKTNSSNLNPRYTFESFVVGNSNSFAFAAAQNIVNYPAQTNNPLFLYGKSGLGKTHLMQAIGNEVLRKNPDMCVLYVTTEQFMIDMVNCLKEKKMEIFRQRYRDVDMLLVDDVQFIEGRDGTQEEFFHTFNDLHMKNKQIVITSDRKPRDLVTLEERLRTRFEWGLSIDVVLPDYETRVAILRKKAESLNINIKNEVFEYIAERINSNVRELEGALSKIIAYAGISNKEIDITLAENVLASIMPDEIKITPQVIIEHVCDFYKVNAEDVTGPSRVKDVVIPRHVAMYLCKKLTDMNFVTIAKVFGNRDRTSVMHAVDKIMKNIQENSNFKSEIDFIIKDINP